MIQIGNVYNNYKDYLINIKEYIVKDSKEVCILCHGFCSWKDSDSIVTVAKRLNKDGITAIALDFPCHGDSNLSPEYLRVENCISDIKVLEEYIKEKYKVDKISIFGVSFGAYIILNKVIREKKGYYKNIILRSPAIDMKNILINCLIKESINDFKKNRIVKAGHGGKKEVIYDFYEDLIKNDILKLYNKNERIVLIQGNIDDTAPIEDTYKFIKLDKNLELIEMKNVNHRMTGIELDMVANIVNNIIKRK
ncbi:MAG: alpha/beta fold hydrolase [Clostridia bacterium]|nr:alpha/beta fold hydrolase [Clostridia bacterium]